LGAVRNQAVRFVERVGADLVVISDADAIVATRASLDAALAQAPYGGLHLPYDQQRYLTADETAALFAGQEPPAAGSFGNGAIYVTSPASWWEAGGQDERFSGWGGEDDQIVACAATLTSLVRHPGVVWSLHHADERRPVGTVEHRPNARLADRYGKAWGHPAQIRRLIAERPE
jgi:hypothetical protein